MHYCYAGLVYLNVMESKIRNVIKKINIFFPFWFWGELSVLKAHAVSWYEWGIAVLPVRVCSVTDPTAEHLLTPWPAPTGPAAPLQAHAGTAAARNNTTKANCKLLEQHVSAAFILAGWSVSSRFNKAVLRREHEGTTHTELYSETQSCSGLNYTTRAIICLM